MSTPDAPGIDFDQVYQGKPVVGAAGLVPWDIGEPQPALVELEHDGEIRGEVLDVGCGLAENALFLASRGYRVTGIDFAPTAVERARERARARGLTAAFTVGDATRLDGFDNRFDTVLDSALYHCLSDEQQPGYAAALHRACRPGATLHLFCLREQMVLPGPRAIGEENLRTTFGQGWRITRLRPASYTTAFTRRVMEEISEALPEPPDPAALDEIPTDDRGRYRMPVWQLTATRLP
ncbi:class I SAM-dependent methyltransferase [Amycolatopsis rhizosphaerae]|uniref:Class I SAM-dependent methyltransferase n=1 Tax=Amycolatopsis rhizosphaerae TaxID=2053003 RepID=A0A558C0Y2_9PSEU|nr:class I SAM-dependent methyltransferase [Amycolatopsis rhizosphaerae]TVT42394.1 class I SAM-dependent methyltransferase [Amycolatopsis rhizosphaerae]